ncbi:hypothetical protein CDD83_5104 [Cordyceps sp. RAO-2017]|nr:hypothetical protein CDD83_5104 [Cordyceps sp. RAO-2017]
MGLGGGGGGGDGGGGGGGQSDGQTSWHRKRRPFLRRMYFRSGARARPVCRSAGRRARLDRYDYLLAPRMTTQSPTRSEQTSERDLRHPGVGPRASGAPWQDRLPACTMM